MTLTAVLVFAIGATSGSLPGSNFEIDGVNPTNSTGSNLKVDGPAPAIDWASVNEPRQEDQPTGQQDDSYQGGVKEDTACPGEVTGSIPNNKSDLKTFGAYTEPEASGPGFLNLFWVRVNNPSGTTLMDFELNQSGASCPTGPNKVRTAGDLLIEYAIDQGGAVATISARTWTGSAWGPTIPLPGQAIGTINLVPIPVAESDGLTTAQQGPLAARTFGEMLLDLDFIFHPGVCESFGSAMLKSRSSDAFSSQLKDFIRPIPVNITNCGSVIIRKQTNPDEANNSTLFDYTKAFSTDPATGDTFQLADDGVKTFNNVLIGNGYTVHEDDLPVGWDFESLNCDASTGVTPSISGRTVTFNIDNAADILDCTYTNRARATLHIKKVTDDGHGTFGFTSNTLTPASWDLITTAAGDAGSATRDFTDLLPGTYDAAEVTPAGWHLVGIPSCSDSSPVSAIVLSGGEDTTCTFHNARNQGGIDISKLRKHAAGGSGDQPHPGVTFTITGGSLPAGGVTRVTDAQGHACVDGLVVSSFVGDYTVTETVPAGYHNVGGTSQTVTVPNAAATCSAGTRPLVTFHNMPLTNVRVSVDSQVNGGTASTIDCGSNGSASTGANGDGALDMNDKEPTVITCTITVDP